MMGFPDVVLTGLYPPPTINTFDAHEHATQHGRDDNLAGRRWVVSVRHG